MRRFLFSALIFIFVSTSAQNSPQLNVYQYFGTDSLTKTIAKTITYNARGQIATEQYINWKTPAQEGCDDGTYSYFYNDTFLIKRYYGSADGDSSRTEYTYDANGKLIRQSHFELKAVGNTGGYIRPGDGGNTNSMGRRWEQTSEVNFTYDSKGRKILYDATRLHYSPQNMYKWEYDDQNRVTVQLSYSRGRLTWREDYQYFDWGYRYWRIWYDEEGSPRHESDESHYWPLYFYSCKLDKSGRLIEEKITDEKENSFGRTVTSYNKEGKILKTINYNAKDEQSVTHLFVYVK